MRALVAFLKACAASKDVERGQRIHAEIIKEGCLERNPIIGSTLVSMYAECGWIAKAQDAFDIVHVRDTVLWNALITGYVKQGLAAAALNQYETMRWNGATPTAVTYVCVVKACVSMGAIERGREIHAEILRAGMLKEDLVVGNTLIDMYAKAGLFSEAKEVFEMLPVRSVISWTALLAGYATFGHGEEAMCCFKRMQRAGISPNAITYACILRACGSLEAAEEGHRLHAEIVSVGLAKDLTVGNALVDMYAKCGLLGKAQEVFDQLPSRSVILWTALIAGYVKHENAHEALICLDSMWRAGVSPNAITFLCSLKACGSVGAIDKGQEIYSELARIGCLERELPVANALIDMYAKCGSLIKAQEVFGNLSVRDIITWTSLIAGYVQHDCGEEALDCFEQMEGSGCSPNAATFVCTLQACGRVGAIAKGECLHIEASRKGLDTNLHVGSTLVDMYARCGVLSRAQEVFEKLPVQDEALWNALIAGYVQIGENKSVFSLFDKMMKEGKKPDLITFTTVLNTCSRAGLMDKCETFFEAMSKEHGVAPTLEHHSCVVDLLCRRGELLEAIAKVKKLPFQPNLVVWRSVLAACQKWGNVTVGTHVFQFASQLNGKDGETPALLIA
ncbi:hypothetical protein GOP47_0023249 [Adiantum capillus-veneris]|uniref:Pentatricopeptide repeat-containing protein n=1 Tax=Adiantum capillus-veneris TaxID=13818 RepID=A0A9D4Z6B9_ADICA|nr:hypothetical protein GOP47_0023249 [Adiantum capillus-veneris]